MKKRKYIVEEARKMFASRKGRNTYNEKDKVDGTSAGGFHDADRLWK